MDRTPRGELTIRVQAMPKDTNPSGDVFGGWILSQMDIAGGVFCKQIAMGRGVTIAIDSTQFRLPVFIADTLCCYVNFVKQGRTSMTVHIEAWVNREYDKEKIILVTEGEFTFVKVDEDRNPTPIED